MSDDISRRLIMTIIAMDQHLPHGTAEVTAETDETAIPAWCQTFKEALHTPGGDCCNMCAELSDITIRALNESFAGSCIPK